MQVSQAPIVRRIGRGIDAAVDRVVRRTGRSPDDDLILVTREVLQTRCRTVSSVNAYADRVINLDRYFDSKGVETLSATRDDLLQHAQSNEGYAPQTQAVRLAFMKSFYDVAEDLEKVDISPYRRMPKVRHETEQHAPPLTQLQIESVLDAITEDFDDQTYFGLTAYRDHALINLMVHTAIRAFEAGGLVRDGMVPTGDGAMMDLMGKNSEGRAPQGTGRGV